MQVNSLLLYLRSLRVALSSTDPKSAGADDLESACESLASFSTLEVAQLAAFLRQADEFRRSGSISVPSIAQSDADGVKASLDAVASLTERMPDLVQNPARFKEVRNQARADLLNNLNRTLAPLAINVTFKDDAKGLDKQIQAASMKAVVERFRSALAGATDSASLETPERRQAIDQAASGLTAKDLKAILAGLGISGRTPAKAEQLVALIVSTITGIQPSTGKKASKKSVDEALVARLAEQLKGNLEKSLDAGVLTDAEVDAQIAVLKQCTEVTIQAILREVGLERFGKAKKKMLDNVKLRLTEATLAREGSLV